MSLFELVFQSGDFTTSDSSWITDLLISIAGAAIGAGATFGALYWTLKSDKIKEEKKRVQLQIEKVRYFQSLLKNVKTDWDTQIDSLREFYFEVGKNPLELPLLTQNSQNDVERVVSKINQEDYYHAYLGQLGDGDKSVEEFRKIFSLLDYFDATSKVIKESLRVAFDFDYQRKTKVKNLIEEVMDDAASFLVNPKFANQHEMLEFINTTIVNFYQNRKDESDLRFFHDNFINVLKVGLIDYGRKLPEVDFLLRKLKNSTFIFNEIQLQNNSVANDFIELADRLQKGIESFSKNSGRLFEYKPPVIK